MTTPTDWLISYDIADPRRLRRVERAIAAVGRRVHYSLFHCQLDAAQLATLQRRLARLIDHRADSLRYQPWCPRDRAATRHLGASADPGSADAWIV